MAHPVERELIKVTAYKSRTKFSDRQDYLGSILNAVMKLADEDFDNLSDEAADWANAAVNAKNNKDDIPDFDEVAASEEDADEADPDDDDEDEADGGSDTDDSDTDSGDTDAESDGDDDEPDDDDEDEPEPDEDDGDDEADEDDEGDPTDDNPEDDDDEDEPEDDEADEEPPVKKSTRKAAPKPVKKAEKAADKPAKKTPKRTPYGNDDDVVLDKWGCMEGSKNSRALALFEKGATSKEVKEKLGGTYYNILKKMEQDGHTLEKEGAVIKLIHKAEKGKKPAPKPTEKKAEKPAPKKGKK